MAEICQNKHLGGEILNCFFIVKVFGRKKNFVLFCRKSLAAYVSSQYLGIIPDVLAGAGNFRSFRQDSIVALVLKKGLIGEIKESKHSWESR